jgi:hypothetical protein
MKLISIIALLFVQILTFVTCLTHEVTKELNMFLSKMLKKLIFSLKNCKRYVYKTSPETVSSHSHPDAKSH